MKYAKGRHRTTVAVLLAILPTASLRAQEPEPVPPASASRPPVSLVPGARIRLRAPSVFEIPGLFEGGKSRVRVVAEDEEFVTLARDPDERLVLLKPGAQVTGRLVSLDARSVTLVQEGTEDPVRLDRASVATLEVSDGRRSQVGRSALRGALVAASVGALLGVVACSSAPTASGSTTADCALLSAVAFAAPGLVIGAVAGRGRGEAWRLAAAMTRPRFGLTVTLRF